MAFVEITGDPISSSEQVTDLIYLVFHFALTFLLFMAFFEVLFVQTWFPVLEGWIGLGLMLVYLAIASLSKANCTIKYKNNVAVLATCYFLTGVGCLFAIFGCVGGKRIKHRQEKMQGAILDVDQS